LASVSNAGAVETDVSPADAAESPSFSGLERFHSWKAPPFFPFELPPKEKPLSFVLGAAALADSRDARDVDASGAQLTIASIDVSIARSTGPGLIGNSGLSNIRRTAIGESTSRRSSFGDELGDCKISVVFKSHRTLFPMAAVKVGFRETMRTEAADARIAPPGGIVDKLRARTT
jgi:hypothetical protein